MESDQSIFHDLQNSGNRWSNYFRQNPERLSYGLLALLYILILALFITVFSNSSSSGNLQLVSKKEINDFNSKVSKLSSEMDRLQSTFIKKKCQDDWIQFENSCYYISKTRFDWTAARTMCQNKESDLLVINNAKEQLFISGKTNPSSYKRFWLGMHDTDEEGLWKWVDETNYETSYKGKNTAMILAACPLAPMKVFAICYIDIQKGEALTHPPLILEFRLGTVVKKFWTKGEPNDHDGEEDCALLWNNGEWNDVPCSYDSSYAVCEKKL